MDSLRNFVKHLLRSRNLELRRRDLVDFDRRRAALLDAWEVDLVIDVGANRGQYASALRTNGYAKDIVSFEPLPDAYGQLQARFSQDLRWQGFNAALGRVDGIGHINTSNDSVSSSVLHPTTAYLDAVPQAHISRETSVQFHTLDGLWPTIAVRAREPYLKIDVQGFEHAVIDGALSSLKHVKLLEVEMALSPLYDDGSQIYDLLPRLHSLGFQAIGVENGYIDPETHFVLDVDVLLARR